MNTKLEPVHTSFKKSAGTKAWKLLEKLASVYEKMYNGSFRCLIQILSYAFPHHFRSN